MKSNIFERELKPLINYVREYGIEHMKTNIDSNNWSEKNIRKEFFQP